MIDISSLHNGYIVLIVVFDIYLDSSGVWKLCVMDHNSIDKYEQKNTNKTIGKCLCSAIARWRQNETIWKLRQHFLSRHYISIYLFFFLPGSFIMFLYFFFSNFLWYVTSNVQQEGNTIFTFHSRLTGAYGDEAAHHDGDDDAADTEVTIRDVVQGLFTCPAKNND